MKNNIVNLLHISKVAQSGFKVTALVACVGFMGLSLGLLPKTAALFSSVIIAAQNPVNVGIPTPPPTPTPTPTPTPAPTGTLTVCKEDNQGNPLSDWNMVIGQTTAQVVPTTLINVTSSVGTDSPSLPAGFYIIKTTGTYRYGTSAMIADAGYSYRPIGIPEGCDCWVKGLDLPSGTNGLMALVNGTAPNWGVYTDSHTYVTVYEHTGGPINISLYDNVYTDNLNNGNFAFEIYSVDTVENDPQAPLVTTQTTDQNGCTAFSLPYGTHFLYEVLQEDWDFVSRSDNASVADPITIDANNQNVNITYVNEFTGVVVPPVIPAQPANIRILNHLGADLGCNGVTNNRNITVDWDDNTEPDLAYYQYDIIDRNDFARPVVSQYSGAIRNIDGTYQYRARAVDIDGNVSEPTPWCYVTLDRSTPLVSLSVTNSPTRDLAEIILNGDFEKPLSEVFAPVVDESEESTQSIEEKLIWTTENNVSLVGEQEIAERFTITPFGSSMIKFGAGDAAGTLSQDFTENELENGVHSLSFYYNFVTMEPEAGYEEAALMVSLDGEVVYELAASDIRKAVESENDKLQASGWQFVSIPLEGLRPGNLTFTYFPGADDSTLLIDQVSTNAALIGDHAQYHLTGDDVSGVTQVGYRYTVNGVEYTQTTEPTLTFTLQGQPDNGVLTYFSIDAAGNKTEQTSTVVWDAKALTVPVTIDKLATEETEETKEETSEERAETQGSTQEDGNSVDQQSEEKSDENQENQDTAESQVEDPQDAGQTATDSAALDQEDSDEENKEASESGLIIPEVPGVLSNLQQLIFDSGLTIEPTSTPAPTPSPTPEPTQPESTQSATLQ